MEKWEDAEHGVVARIAAVSLGTIFVILGAVAILKDQGQYSIALVGAGTPLIYLGLGYGLPPQLSRILDHLIGRR
jgi:hypothetical protein